MEVRYPDIKMEQFVSVVKGFQIDINANPKVSKLYFELIENSKDEFKDEKVGKTVLQCIFINLPIQFKLVCEATHSGFGDIMGLGSI